MGLKTKTYYGPYVACDSTRCVTSWGDIDETLCGAMRCLVSYGNKDIQVWVGNLLSVTQDRDYAIDEDGDYPSTDEQIGRECWQFEKGYCAAIGTLNRIYGKTNVEIRWGLVRYTM